MSYESNAAARYRANAEELRNIAASVGAAQTHQMLIRVAMDYEKMATAMDELDAMHRCRQASSCGMARA